MRAALVILLLVMTAAVAHAAQAPRPGRLEGVWAFETDPYDGGCKMTGRLVVRAATRPGVHACTLTAQEVCPEIRVRAEQSCTVRVSGSDIAIESTVLRVTPQVSYAPDNFQLRPDAPGRMSGRLESFATAPARFFRPADVPVS